MSSFLRQKMIFFVGLAIFVWEKREESEADPHISFAPSDDAREGE